MSIRPGNKTGSQITLSVGFIDLSSSRWEGISVNELQSCYLPSFSVDFWGLKSIEGN